MFFDSNGNTFPTLMNKAVLDKLPTLTVDMGAVPHLCNGADIMAPGIVKIAGQFLAEAIVVVLDEKFSKPIALAKSLYNSEKLSGKKRGKVALNIHYVGDRFWKAFKRM
jgi:PUA domain protein